MISDELSTLVERVEALERDLENAERDRDDYKDDYDTARKEAREADEERERMEGERDEVIALFKRFMQRWDLHHEVDDEVVRDMRWTLKVVA